MQEHKHTNSLINETSPYLLQHAHNPVNWYAWNDETLEKAKRENKLILVSIGYSACHWCHVMEHECFEDEETAKQMNADFICIKVDREERPDIDQIYMLAVQLMTGRGGWPLNCFALPDGRPIYGGTYFPKQQWRQVLANMADVFKNNNEKALDYAAQLTEGVKLAELIKVNEQENDFSVSTIHTMVNNWKAHFDFIEGGPDRAPKFPLPNNYQMLLRYSHSPQCSEEQRALLAEYINLTLTKMAYGGIYDQIGGGFSRYSVDRYWKVPHFEKMLYDNAQLVTLYCEAFQSTRNPLYKQIVFETLAFTERELTSPQGGFYAALDADSEGEEGKYYVWTKEELQTVLKDKFDLFADYYNVNQLGWWEHGNYILLRNESDETVAKKHAVSVPLLQSTIAAIKNELLVIREKRVRPGLDNKIITSWNALMLKAYTDAYIVFDEPHFLDAAIKNADFVLSNSMTDDNVLSHIAGKTINGFLEDYAFFMEALIALYETTFEESYLQKANELMQYCILHYQDKKSGMFYFTSDRDTALISRKMELSDNVIPASNSSVAKSLFKLGHHFENEEYVWMSRKMLNNIIPMMEGYPEGYSNWAMLLQYFTSPFYEVAIVGKSVHEKRKEFAKHYFTNGIFAGCKTESSLPLLRNRTAEGQTLIYVCTGKTCGVPVNDAEQAIKQLI